MAPRTTPKYGFLFGAQNPIAQGSGSSATIASASISTTISGEIKRLTSTIVAAGRISLKHSA
jgi:hypothetical protein